MVRQIAGLLTALLFVAGLSLAAEDKKDDTPPKFTTEIGTFESYKKETLTLKVKGEEKEFKVPGDTPVGYTTDKNKKKILKAKVHLKDVKKGSFVAVTLDEKKKVLGVGVVVTELPKDEDEDKDK